MKELIQINYQLPLSHSEKYFRDNINQIKKIFDLKFIYLPFLNHQQSKTDYKKIIITHRNLLNDKINGFTRNNIAWVKYQGDINHTLFLTLHEIGHLFGLKHCNNECIMGVKTSYRWYNLLNKKIDKKLYCKSCRNFIHYSLKRKLHI